MAEQKAVSFADDIRPMFRQIDIDHMGASMPLDLFSRWIAGERRP
jgi:hypothetical protein